MMNHAVLAFAVAVLFGGAVFPNVARSEPMAHEVVANEAASAASPPTPRRGLRAKPAGAQAYVYKGTASGDNLWDIAGAVVGPAGAAEPIDRNQVMVAILRANPAAFPEGNLHRIQRGLDLTVPARADIRREERAAAASLVAQHRKAYADSRVKPQGLYALAGAVPASAAPAASARAAAQAGAAASSSAAGDGAAASLPAWMLVLGLIGAAGLGAIALRAWSRRPGGLASMALEPLEDEAAPDLEASEEVARDRQRAEAAAAGLYQEDLSLPEAALEDEPQPAPLPAADEAGAEALASALTSALADAYREVARPQEAVVAAAKPLGS